MKRVLLAILFLLFTGNISICNAQNALIKDVRGEIFEDSAEIIIEANCDIDYLDYTLQNPPRIIIDPIGKVYSDLKEVVTFESGPVKKVSIAKGKAEKGLTGNFYPLDFVVIELASFSEYNVKKEVEKESIVVNIGKKKEVEVSKLIPEIEERLPEEAVEPLPIEEEVIPPPPHIPPKLEIEEAKVVEEEKPLQPAPQLDTSAVIPLPELDKGEPSAAGETIKMVYTIGEGDTLDISVWQHSELDKKVIVRPDGYISFPLVGDIRALGLTPPQLASGIRENLSRMIRDPQVTVIVSGFGSKNVFVLGEVGKPGSYPYRGGTSVLDAISEAGGWKNSAVLNSVMLVRKAFTEAPEAHRLNVYALVKYGDFSQNMPLGPGDIIYVPKSFIANIGGFIENLKISIGAYITESTKVFD
ncbi:MAG: polysaccharide biosynthesis/export family protein [Candidatus Omnitrophica bacterium]|nr:polysaccharide biosynthesis/export family protein [Candidatus Omnitrophota bacterium]